MSLHVTDWSVHCEDITPAKEAAPIAVITSSATADKNVVSEVDPVPPVVDMCRMFLAIRPRGPTQLSIVLIVLMMGGNAIWGAASRYNCPEM
jgi:hypothetical protein